MTGDASAPERAPVRGHPLTANSAPALTTTTRAPPGPPALWEWWRTIASAAPLALSSFPPAGRRCRSRAALGCGRYCT